MRKSDKPILLIRLARPDDIPAIRELERKVYPSMSRYSAEVLLGQMNNFPEGQFVAVFDDKVVGYACAIRMGIKAVQPHSWREVSGEGFGHTHDPIGEFLYGIDTFVDPAFRGLRIAHRFHQQRKKLCQHLRLKGIVFGARLPSLQKKLKKGESVAAYVEAVRQKRQRDSYLSFYLRHGFEVISVLADYLPQDKESLGHAVLLQWQNPDVHASDGPKALLPSGVKSPVRVATVQYMQRRVASFEEFAQIVTYFVDVVADYESDFVVFPEFLTLQLLSIANEPISPDQAITHLTEYTERYVTLFRDLAVRFNVNIIAGTHPTKGADGSIHNTSYIFLRDGTMHEQPKIHSTPSERYWWNVEGGHTLRAINTDCGPIGVLICYDSEFPELARHLVNQGANILFVPFCTDERLGYLRVRYSAQARAVENQVFVVMSGNVGNLPGVHNMDIQYAQSCILTPCDFAFARDGIAADTTPNVETVAFADLRVEDLYHARTSGTVRNLRDRRHDLYSVSWHGGQS